MGKRQIYFCGHSGRSCLLMIVLCILLFHLSGCSFEKNESENLQNGGAPSAGNDTEAADADEGILPETDEDMVRSPIDFEQSE